MFISFPFEAKKRNFALGRKGKIQSEKKQQQKKFRMSVQNGSSFASFRF